MTSVAAACGAVVTAGEVAEDDAAGVTGVATGAAKNSPIPKMTISINTTTMMTLLVPFMKVFKDVYGMMQPERKPQKRSYMNLNVPMMFCINESIFVLLNGARSYDCG